MNVIGIIQTDLNEFNVLFVPDQNSGQNGAQQGQQDQQSQQGQQNQASQDNDSLFLDFLEDQTGGQNQGAAGNQQSGPQEMTVRIKGIPEGQKANFLQMYQILQDAKDTRDLEQSLTIVNQGDPQQNQGAGGSGGQQ
ncbi:hypothetical protein FOI68_12355 [Brevibacillus sp. LEMMJ03]|uniref:hypothetical protein n=1 Tax=Brevibacillus sp. LEMMJ03 TaxID=2595056 RepID=UPI00117F6EA5|nr:hypothetical protein [Brevibacillus sp. LEMMJ03]TRY25595.1 hypothetical protein FOI68_12355 [Brevibacillus sp. LEMMJ03]